MRRLVIYCDGGFGNRFNALISGRILARELGLSPQVVWPVNNWCGAAYHEIFDQPELEVVNRELATYKPECEKYQYYIVEDRLGLAKEWVTPLLTPSMQEARAFAARPSLDIFYYTALIPAFMDFERVKEEVRRLKFQAEIAGRAQAFIESAGLTVGDYLGVQIRKTDFGANGADDNNLFELVAKVPQKRVFVCSDDKTVEDRFKALPNVVVVPKSAYVEKRIDGDWMAVTTDHSGRLYAGNINRSGQSVIDAIVDLMLLSYSQVVKTSNSTFLHTALLMQASRH